MFADHERRAIPAFLVGAVFFMSFFMSSCFGGEPTSNSAGLASDEASFVSAQAGVRSLASVAGATLGETVADVGESQVAAAVIPSDDAVLSLDADRLADLISTGSIADLIVLLAPSDDIDLRSQLTFEDEWEGFLFDLDGDAHRTRTGGTDPTFAGLPIQAIEEQVGLTIIVVDGIVERRDPAG